MRRTMVLVTATALALVLAAGVAFAQPWGYVPGGQGVSKNCEGDCQGTTYPDDLFGSNAPNTIRGLGGNETPTHGDYIPGHGGDDTLYGNRGGDRIEGGNGADAIYGGPAQNLLIGGTGLDRIYGGPGRETIMVRDGYRDVVNCGGPGDFIASRDRLDEFRNC